MSQDTYRGYVIYITAANPIKGDLTLSDNGSTAISDSGVTYDSVFWVVNDGVPNIDAITGINYESGSQIFSDGPNEATPEQGQRSLWSATFTVGSFPVGAFEEYTISWRDTDGNVHIHDPKIGINP
jgi:hypothetical protein